MSSNYVPLEGGILNQFGTAAPSFSTSATVDLFTTTSFLYSVAIMIIVVVAGWRYMLAGVWRMQASQAGMTKSNNEFRRVTLGLLGVLSLFVILYTFNRGLLKGDVGLEGLKSKAGTGGGRLAAVVGSNNSSNTSPNACDTTQNVIAQLSSDSGICGGASCSKLSGCAYQQYLPIIESESVKQGVDKNLIISTLCTESGGKSDQHQNPDGTYDCGIMQINQSSPCDSSSLSPETNIRLGVSLLKKAAGRVYQNIPEDASIAASYNAGSGYNQPSADCNTSSGFPFTPPKWACPINPGDGRFNMCAVKSYACQINACVKQLAGN